MRIMLLTGMTGAGKSRLLADIVKSCGEPVNIICGDILQAYRNFSVVTNSPLDGLSKLAAALPKEQVKVHLYSSLDILKDNFNAFEYAEMTKACLDPDRLNIIEGGSAFYHHYLRTVAIPNLTMTTYVLYYDHRDRAETLAVRARQIILNGALDEVFDFEADRVEAGVAPLRLTPIGFDLLAEAIRRLNSPRPKRRHMLLTDTRHEILLTLRELIRQHRGYSTTQLKYMRKYINTTGDYWIDVQKEPHLFGFAAFRELARSVSHKPPVLDFMDGINTKEYRLQLDRLVNEAVGKGFEDKQLAWILARINPPLARQFQQNYDNRLIVERLDSDKFSLNYN